MKRLLFLLLFSTALFAQSNQPNTIIVQSGTIWLVQASKSYDLWITPQAGTYAIRGFIKNHFAAYPGHYEVELDIGNKELCSTYGWGTPGYVEVPLVCPTSNYITVYKGFGFDPTQHLFLVLTENGPDYWGVDIDDVSLTFTTTN